MRFSFMPKSLSMRVNVLPSASLAPRTRLMVSPRFSCNLATARLGSAATTAFDRVAVGDGRAGEAGLGRAYELQHGVAADAQQRVDDPAHFVVIDGAIGIDRDGHRDRGVILREADAGHPADEDAALAHGGAGGGARRLGKLHLDGLAAQPQGGQIAEDGHEDRRMSSVASTIKPTRNCKARSSMIQPPLSAQFP